MKKVVILGAGRSAPYIIRRMVDLAPERGWEVVVADIDKDAAQRSIGGEVSYATALALNATEEPELAGAIKGADVVCNFLAPRFQPAVARHCVEEGAHMVSVSYISEETRELDGWARDQGVMLLGEMGLDPGIDHMMAMEAVQEVRSRGGKILSFRSFGSGVPEPDSKSNPLQYLITWNPWNVATAGRAGAQYMLDGQIRIVPHRRLFLHTWPVEVEGVGTLEAYPNRDSLSYRDHFDLHYARTMIRGTLRWPGFCETWAKIVKLGLTNTNLNIPDLADLSPREVVGMFLPLPVPADRVVEAATLFLELNPTGPIISNLRFIGLFDDEPSGCPGHTAADMVAHLLEARLAPPPGARDMVILVHQMDVKFGDQQDEGCERVTYTMVDTGDALGMSAMAKTVGLPAALAAEMMLAGELQLSGCLLPTDGAIYKPVLKQLKEEGLGFTVTTEAIQGCGESLGSL
ncbi:MAG: saccharopine dehydrogenase NADP-binding domain-containing protein [Thermoanaerobaculales bacterium]|nr:saccharopine dehydrogenase NADP-binding domain-containing protein [Thermoanaerobaculales bacterium]